MPRPDILILEGLNVLQVTNTANEFVSDYFDFSIYIDADEDDIREWYVQRFFAAARDGVHRIPTASSGTSPSCPTRRRGRRPRRIWDGINGRNLSENILPTRERASLILRKGRDHRVTEVRLHKL